MNKSKKILVIAFLIFLTIVIFIVIDMARRTTFPGRKTEKPADTISMAIQPENEIFSKQ